MKTRLATALAGFVFTSLFFINLCNAVFACGCKSLWSGADALCNVHHPNGIHCPVCSHGALAYSLTFAAIVIPQLAAAFFINRSSWTLRLVIVLALFPLAGALAMTIAGWLDGYPVNRVVFRSGL